MRDSLSSFISRLPQSSGRSAGLSPPIRARERSLSFLPPAVVVRLGAGMCDSPPFHLSAAAAVGLRETKSRHAVKRDG